MHTESSGGLKNDLLILHIDDNSLKLSVETKVYDFKPDKKASGFVVEGTMKWNAQVSIPDSAKLIAFWSVTAGTPDYGYFWGEGTIDKVNKTFRIEFPEIIDEPIMNNFSDSKFGVASIFLCSGTNLKSGTYGDQVNDFKVYGAISNKCVIYMRQSNPLATRFLESGFVKGFNAGVGVAGSGSFDDIKPCYPYNFEMIIDTTFSWCEKINWSKK